MLRKVFFILFFLLLTSNIKSQIASDSLINSFISEWIGVPYRWGGSTKKGIDCSQFNKKFYQKIYQVELSNTCKEQYSKTKRVSFSELTEGDLLFFRSKSSPSGWHCGIYLGLDKFIHASNKKTGVIISNLQQRDYKFRFKSGGRIF